MTKYRYKGSTPSDKKGALSYKSAAEDRYDYSEHGRHIYPKTKYSNSKYETTLVRFGGGQDKKVLKLKEGKKGKYYVYEADPAYKGKSKHRLNLAKSKALESKKGKKNEWSHQDSHTQRMMKGIERGELKERNN